VSKDGGPAFARPIGEYKEVGAGRWSDAQAGMSLRDYFAAKAMQAILGGQGIRAAIGEGSASIDEVCAASYRTADAMLKARNA
jgi:hypothetical protein